MLLTSRDAVLSVKSILFTTESIWRTLQKSHLADEVSNHMMLHNLITLLADSIPKGIENMTACLLTI